MSLKSPPNVFSGTPWGIGMSSLSARSFGKNATFHVAKSALWSFLRAAPPPHCARLCLERRFLRRIGRKIGNPGRRDGAEPSAARAKKIRQTSISHVRKGMITSKLNVDVYSALFVKKLKIEKNLHET